MEILAVVLKRLLMHCDDMELVGVFTRRDPANVSIDSGAKAYNVSELENMKDDIDVLIICGGSATDLPEMTPKYAAMFNVIDSFDTHANIPVHFANVDKAATAAGKIGIISCGWDPGMFSLNRLYAKSVLPGGSAYTFWGKGVSQGHSDAIRRIDGVVDARQYTVPVPEALEQFVQAERILSSQPDRSTPEYAMLLLRKVLIKPV